MPGVLYVAFKRGRGTDYSSMLHIESGSTFSLEPDTPPPAPASRQSGVTFLLGNEVMPPNRSQSGVTFLLEMEQPAKAVPVRGYFSLASAGVKATGVSGRAFATAQTV